MFLFTGNFGPFLALLLLGFPLLWAAISFASFWAFKQTDYYQHQFQKESVLERSLLNVIIVILAYFVSWFIFF